MAYCKFCGMNSKTSDKCEWCGRALAQAPPPPKPPDLPLSTADRVSLMDEQDRKSRVTFYIANVVILMVAGTAVAIHKPLYPFMIGGGLFASGFLLGRLGIIPPFENEWAEIGIPLLLVLLLPALIVCIGYIAYGLLFRSMDLTVVWLLTTYIIMVTLLEAVSLIIIGGVPTYYFLLRLIIEFVSLGAIIVGWMASTAFRLDR